MYISMNNHCHAHFRKFPPLQNAPSFSFVGILHPGSQKTNDLSLAFPFLDFYINGITPYEIF